MVNRVNYLADEEIMLRPRLVDQIVKLEWELDESKENQRGRDCLFSASSQKFTCGRPRGCKAEVGANQQAEVSDAFSYPETSAIAMLVYRVTAESIIQSPAEESLNKS